MSGWALFHTYVRTDRPEPNPSNADVAEGSAEGAIRRGADAWGTQSHANFSFAYAGRASGTTFVNNGRNEMFFRNWANGAVIAETMWTYNSSGRLVDADIAFYDGGFQFFTGTSGCVSGFYLEDIAAHAGVHDSPRVLRKRWRRGGAPALEQCVDAEGRDSDGEAVLDAVGLRGAFGERALPWHDLL